MKRRYCFMSLLLTGTVAMTAQETYTNAELATKDLNGTARYVGMGTLWEPIYPPSAPIPQV